MHVDSLPAAAPRLADPGSSRAATRGPGARLAHVSEDASPRRRGGLLSGLFGGKRPMSFAHKCQQAFGPRLDVSWPWAAARLSWA
jgi:hypothetical protein